MSTHLQPGVDGEAAHRRVHAGHILAAADLLKHCLLPVIPKAWKTASSPRMAKPQATSHEGVNHTHTSSSHSF